MKPTLLMIILLPLDIACQPAPIDILPEKTWTEIGQIPAPEGYQRMAVSAGSFGEWLRKLPLKQDKRVFLYDGRLKRNQSAQFAVIDISVGKKDLQQCADAVMRLRAEYFYNRKEYDSIDFTDNNKTHYRLKRNANRAEFDNYLEKVFSYCGTLSLENQLKPKNHIDAIEPGNVFIKGGSPGHAVIVVDVAINAQGKKVFMIAQSYMPAQDIHLLINPDNINSAWYELPEGNSILTPEWVFEKKQLRSW